MKTTAVLAIATALLCHAAAFGHQTARYPTRSYWNPYAGLAPITWQTRIVTPPPRPGSYLDRQERMRAAKRAQEAPGYASQMTTTVKLPAAQKAAIDGRKPKCAGGVCKFSKR